MIQRDTTYKIYLLSNGRFVASNRSQNTEVEYFDQMTCATKEEAQLVIDAWKRQALLYPTIVSTERLEFSEVPKK